ncbi:Diguanylate cyclase DosC [Sporomusa ovata DSM 2662]|uniref:Response regulator containing a CheY-like receiver domain and a GGDEF domain n=1 Tax=Sporomusa ovata TaxID=2378 RepID=A0A0U1L562_9FIRM|nr:sensor domain-containing diguanylate cyclase [Sporomusa ovata]EQB28509.1 diguanylate cyclase DosC [Sporomusa ovata DSM 2662]CQR74838.1 Response regulator containing a CheY-like receiver domain and a GGDEF domain [Sporomusa ovata]
MKIQDIGGLLFKDRSEVGLAGIRRLWKRQAGRQRKQLHMLEQAYANFESTIAQITNMIKDKGKLTDLLDQLVNEAGMTFGSEHVFLSLLEGQPQVFWVVAYRGSCEPRETTLDQKLMGATYVAGQMVYITSRDNTGEHLPRTLLGIPIMIDGKLTGVFEVFFECGKVLTKEQLKLAEIYAAQAGIAVKMARLNDTLTRKSKEIALLHEVGQIVAKQPSPSILLEQVGKTLSSFLKVDACAAFVVQRHSATPVVRAAHVQNLLPADVERLEALLTNGKESELWQDTNRVLVTLPLTIDKTVQVMPLFFRQILQGAIVFCWDYVRETSSDFPIEATLATIANQTAMGLEREHLYGSIKKFGLTDTLTEIANRRYFDFVLKKELSRVRRYGQPLSLVMADIDFFKVINDRWGHQTGDIILKEMGSLLKKQFRATDLPARYGGEEFAVILPETDAATAYALAEMIRAQTEKQVFAPGIAKISVTISVGVATIEFSEHLDKITEADLIFAADQALYRAKNVGRNRVEVSKWRNEELAD